MISLAITTYNRPLDTVKAFKKVLNHPMIDEIVISDDSSSELNIELLKKELDKLNSPKIKLWINDANVGMMKNKELAISRCKNEWVIIFDSDNVISPNYLQSIPKELDNDTIYCPSFAQPTFNYTKFSGVTITAKNAKAVLHQRLGDALFNTCNYLVHRDTYLKVFEYDASIKASDTIAFNYRWLKSGRKLKVVPKMTYFHAVHEGSGFLQDVDYNMRRAEEFKHKILSL